jgi:hypothetical protein
MIDMSQQPRLILSGVEILLRFWRAPPAFTLLSNEPDCSHKIEIEDAFIRVCRVQPAPAVTLAINGTLQKTPALYPHSRCQVKKYLLTPGQFNFAFENVYANSQTPSVVVLGFVSAAASSGDYSKNPFRFQHMNLSSLSVELDGKASRKPPMKFIFRQRNEESSYLDGYESLFEGWGDPSAHDDPSDYVGIYRDEWPNGYALFSFRLTQGANRDFLPVVPMGNLRIAGSFATALAETTTLIVYSRFASLLTIDRSRRVEV